MRAGRANRKDIQGAEAVAVEQLCQLVPGAVVERDEWLGTPKVVVARDGFLTGPEGKGRGIPHEAANRFQSDPNRVTKQFLDQYKTLFGHGAGAIEQARVTREVTGGFNGMRTVVWQQELDGIPVFGATLISHVTARGELAAISSHFLSDLENAAKRTASGRAQLTAAPPITLENAIIRAAINIGEEIEELQLVRQDNPVPGKSDGEWQRVKVPKRGAGTHFRLVWLPLDAQKLQLCWEVILTSQSRGETFRVLVDAETGEVLLRHGLTEYISEASYRVFTSDSPSPFSPGHTVPQTGQPSLVERSLVTLAAYSTNASPSGWISDGENQTAGNNVHAHLDRNADDIPDAGSRPQGNPWRVFDFPLDLQQSPSSYTNAAVVNLFYWNNWMHDRLHELGFTEAAGNFQTANFGRGGLGNDPVLADAQDGAGFNNANMTTPPDGIPGRMQMFLFTGPMPQRDGDLDAEIILHEYTHGLSNRRVGGGAGLTELQSRGLGEGWSDFYALALLSEPEDDLDGNYAMGGYVTHRAGIDYLENYYFGIRRYPCSTDLQKNPLTFRDIDPTKANSHPGVPRNPILGSVADAVHSIGEVWCVTLWEARANLIRKYGFAEGNEMMLRLVTDGMNLSPPNPNFLQARDAILLADRVNHAGANQRELWLAFAKRGMGWFASSPSSSTSTGVVESFETLDSLEINPSGRLLSSGTVGGPFEPEAHLITLTNAGNATLQWEIGTTAQWIEAIPVYGELPGGAAAQVLLSLNENVNALPRGTHTNLIFYTNLTSGMVQTQTVVVRAGIRDYFTEQFTNNHDLDFRSLTFTPDGSESFYTVCRETALSFPTDPAGGTVLAVNDHSFAQVALPPETNVSLYGGGANVFYVGSGGFITFQFGDNSASELLSTHFNQRRISAFMSHLHPQSGGTVSWKMLSDRVAVTFENVVEYDSGKPNSFQVEMFFDGRIRITHLDIGHASGVVGLSEGNGVPVDLQMTDFSSFGSCLEPLTLWLPETAREGDGSVEGRVNLPSTAAGDITVSLMSSDISEAVVPAVVTIPAGATGAVFRITITDDADLDGEQPVIVMAKAAGYLPRNAVMFVEDNEVGTLGVMLPAIVSEGAGTVNGTVTVDLPPTMPVSVALESSRLDELQVPLTVTLLPGTTSVPFVGQLVNDLKIDGTQVVTVTARVAGWNDGVTQIHVRDDELLNLRLQLPLEVTEGAGLLPNAGLVSIAGTLGTNLNVALQSNDPEIVVPSSVVIPVGATSAVFNLTVMDDLILEETKRVTVTASAFGFEGDAVEISVRDNEHPAVPVYPVPSDGAVDASAMVVLSWDSGETVPATNLYEVYLGTTPVIEEMSLQGGTTELSWALPLLAPATTYYWRVVARRGGETSSAVWQFTTRGVDHFTFDPIMSPQVMDSPFAVRVVARDDFGQVVSNYSGALALEAYPGIRPETTVRILSFTAYADLVQEYPQTLQGISRFFTNFNVTATANTNSATLATLLADKHLFLVPEQEMSMTNEMLLDRLGHALKPVLADFVQRGGMIVVCSYQRNEFLLLNNSELMQVNRTGSSTEGLLSVAAVHPVTDGVPETFAANYFGRFSSSDGTVLVRSTNNDAVTLFKPVGAGHVMLIGTDFNVTNSPHDRMIANAVRLAQSGINETLPMTPNYTALFSNGVWEGSVTIHSAGMDVRLRGTDSSGSSGTSERFEVADNNDLVLLATVSTNVVAPQTEVRYTLEAVNTGPAPAAGVVLTNILPPEATFISANISQGSVLGSGSVQIANIGTIAAGERVTMTVSALYSEEGSFTNHAAIGRAGEDAHPANNFRSLVVTVLDPPVAPVLRIENVVLMQEFCWPTNGVIEPGETVAMAVTLTNLPNGLLAENVRMVLRSTNGIFADLAEQEFGTVIPGGAVGRLYSFTAVGMCGDWVPLEWDWSAGEFSGTVTHSIQLCGGISGLLENFDDIAPPTFPEGWAVEYFGTGDPWRITSAVSDTPPNAFFAPNPATATTNRLVSPPVRLLGTNAQLSFRHRFNTELGFDWGQIDVSINGGPFVEIIAAGGVFVTGNYSFGTKWTGNSGGFISTVIALPPSVTGQEVRFAWQFLSDINRGGEGWYVDGVQLVSDRECMPVDGPALQASRAGEAFQIRWIALPGYLLEWTEDLASSEWNAVDDSPALDNGIGQFIEPTENASRFYRLRRR